MQPSSPVPNLIPRDLRPSSGTASPEQITREAQRNREVLAEHLRLKPDEAPKKAAPAPVNGRYPSWRYHATLPARIINSEAEEPGQGWSDRPFISGEEDFGSDASPSIAATALELCDILALQAKPNEEPVFTLLRIISERDEFQKAAAKRKRD